MKMEYEPILKQMQRLVMTTESRQSLAILQMPFMELQTYVSQQMLDYCVLEQQDISEEEGLGEEAPGDEVSFDVLETKSPNEKVDKSWEEYLSDAVQNEETDGESGKPYEAFMKGGLSLQDHLLFQLHVSSTSSWEEQIGTFLIGNIDDDGYLRCETDDAVKTLSADPEAVKQLLTLIQTFDPPGVGARNLRECLQLQLDILRSNRTEPFLDKYYTLTSLIIENHLQDLAEGRLAKIANRLKKTVQDIQNAFEIIRRLDPKPGKNFGSLNDLRYIIPDIAVKKVGTDYVIIVNETSNVRLKINSFYRRILAGEEKADQEAINFLKEKFNSALWLIKCIEHRRLTLYKITEAIVNFQKGFFEAGPKHLKPLTLREVAETVGLHESTVSRATAGKYIETPKGIFLLKYFFTTRLDTVSGDAMSSVSVKKLIKEIVEREDPKIPLSDQKLTDILKDTGIMVSRRTVTKYREEMMIPSSNRRRRY
jgi:RNA polymerase sigma-54 factor